MYSQVTTLSILLNISIGHENHNQEVCVVLFLIRVAFIERKSICISSLLASLFISSAYLDIAAQFSCSLLTCPSLSLPGLVFVDTAQGQCIGLYFYFYYFNS